MKNNFKYKCLFLLIMVAFSSCDIDDDENEIGNLRNLGGYAHLTDRTISVFDTDEQLNIDLFTNDQVQVESVEIIQDGQVVTEATVSGDNATFSPSALGNLQIGESYPIMVRAQLSNGEIAEAPASISVRNAISITEGPESIRFQDTTTTPLRFSTFSRYADIDNVTASWRRNAGGTFMDLDQDFDPSGDEINLGELDYDAMNLSVGDTLFYRFTAQSGNRTETVETAIPIRSQEFETSNQGTISNNATTNRYNLAEGEFAVGNDTGEIEFNEPQGFRTNQGIEFVEVDIPNNMTAAEYMAETDLFEAEEEFQNRTTMTSTDNVESGDVFIYKVTRQNEDEEEVVNYGIIRIESVTVVNQSDVTIAFEHAEGTIIRQ